MKLLELHILQSFPVTCLNRDDVGAPKSAVFGGVARARVSSQCWKRAIRTLAHERSPEVFAGVRGHYVAEKLVPALREAGLSGPQAADAGCRIAEFLGDRDGKDKENHKTSVALYFSPQELSTIANAAARDFKRPRGSSRRRASSRRRCPHSPHRCRGRRHLRPHGGRRSHADVEGAGLFSHALSTHAVSNEIDFFSAVDDVKPEEMRGAGHIGTIEFNSACYYRYVGLNLDLLGRQSFGHFYR